MRLPISNHYIKNGIAICVCVASLQYMLYCLYRGGAFSKAYDFTTYLNPYGPDAYTMSVRNTIRGLKEIHLPQNSSVARPFLRAKGHYRIAPGYDLSFCLIEKSMCSILQSIFCYLYDTEGFVENNRTIAGDFWYKRWCEKRNEFFTTREKYLIAPYISKTIFVIRHPIEKFISGFVNKCIVDKTKCYGCGGDVLCAVEAFHAEMMQLNHKNWNVSIPLKKELNQTYEGRHMAPSNWQCDLYDEVDNAVFIKYGETPEELAKTYEGLMRALEGSGVEKHKLQFIMNGVQNRTQHATKKLGIRDKYYEQIKASPKHVQLLNDVYFYDYQIFDFEPLK